MNFSLQKIQNLNVKTNPAAESLLVEAAQHRLAVRVRGGVAVRALFRVATESLAEELADDARRRPVVVHPSLAPLGVTAAAKMTATATAAPVVVETATAPMLVPVMA